MIDIELSMIMGLSLVSIENEIQQIYIETTVQSHCRGFPKYLIDQCGFTGIRLCAQDGRLDFDLICICLNHLSDD